jgi:hypothetical protein
VLREVNSQARFEALYRDSECRRKRREATEREKMLKEEEEIRILQSRCQPRRRAWEPRWANEQSIAYARKQQALEDRRQREAESKENEALKECSFAPRLVAGDGLRRRKLAKARRILEELANEQKIWAQKVEDLREELLRNRASDDECDRGGDALDSDEESEASQRTVDMHGADENREAADRRFRLGMLQVLDNLARLQTQALTAVSRALAPPAAKEQCGEKPPVVAATDLKDVCPAFDVDLLPQLRSEVSRFDVPAEPGSAWEVPGALLRAPIPVSVPPALSPPLPKEPRPDVEQPLQRDEARPWTWN